MKTGINDTLHTPILRRRSVYFVADVLPPLRKSAQARRPRYSAQRAPRCAARHASRCHDICHAAAVTRVIDREKENERQNRDSSWLAATSDAATPLRLCISFRLMLFHTTSRLFHYARHEQQG